MKREEVIRLAQKAWADEGQIEIDDDADVSWATGGAYVQSWVWVEVPDQVVQDVAQVPGDDAKEV